jgi:hypothetical protein
VVAWCSRRSDNAKSCSLRTHSDGWPTPREPYVCIVPSTNVENGRPGNPVGGQGQGQGREAVKMNTPCSGTAMRRALTAFRTRAEEGGAGWGEHNNSNNRVHRTPPPTIRPVSGHGVPQ